ncbi:MAG: lysophospholipid acyltransferase family protein [Candidatus Methylacidiphilales bacterium]
MKSLRRWFNRHILPVCGPFLVATLIRLIGCTLRYQIRDEAGLFRSKGRGPCVFAFWHNRILLMPYLYEKYTTERTLVVMISRSRDGQMIAATAERFGIGAARGSSSGWGGTSALIRLARDLSKGTSDVGVTPDGPRGPRYTVQEGVLFLARTSGCPLIPVTYHLSRKWEAKSWDGFQIPKPFARCEVLVGSPIPAGSDDAAEKLRMALGD